MSETVNGSGNDGPINTISSCAFSTPRLQVKAWNTAPSSLTSLEAELSELLIPAVTAFLPEPLRLAKGVDPIAGWIAARNSESDVFTVRDKSTHALFGLLILAASFEPGYPLEIRLGYLLAEQTWGKGIATELVKGLVLWCRENYLSGHLLGGVEKGNPASAAVLIKAGFKRSDVLSSGDTDTFELRLCP